MDKQFFEFWGHIFLAAAKNQKIFEDLMSCLSPDRQQGGKQSRDMEQWLKTWGEGYQAWQSFLSLYKMSPDAHKDTTSQEPMGQELSALIHRNWKEMISLMGVVSRQDYDALVRENDALKKKLEVQEERIQQLQSMLQHKGIFDLQQMAESFQDVLKNQSEQFQDLMQSIQASWQNEGESSSGPDDT